MTFRCHSFWYYSPINESYNGMKYIITFIMKLHIKIGFSLWKRKMNLDIIIKFLKLNNLFNDKTVKKFSNPIMLENTKIKLF